MTTPTIEELQQQLATAIQEAAKVLNGALLTASELGLRVEGTVMHHTDQRIGYYPRRYMAVSISVMRELGTGR